MTGWFRWWALTPLSVILVATSLTVMLADDLKPGESVVIQLKDGTLHEGKLKARTQEEVSLDIGSGMSEAFGASEVHAITRASGSVGSPPARTTTPAPPLSAGVTDGFLVPGEGDVSAGPERVAPASDAEVNALPQSGRITLNVKGKLAKDVMAEIAKQADFRVEWMGDAKAKLDVSVNNLGFMETIALICKQNQIGFCEWGDKEGRLITMALGFAVRDYKAKGPFLLTWHGVCTNAYTGKNAPTYNLRFSVDPRCCVKQDGARNPVLQPVVFGLQDGASVRLVSESFPHQVARFSPEWRFLSKQELVAGRVSIEALVGLIVAPKISHAVLPCKTGASRLLKK